MVGKIPQRAGSKASRFVSWGLGQWVGVVEGVGGVGRQQWSREIYPLQAL